MIKEEIIQELQNIVKELTKKDIKIELSRTTDESHGDYASNIALRLGKELGKNPFEIAQEIAAKLSTSGILRGKVKIEAVKPGFINFSLSEEVLLEQATAVLDNPEKKSITNVLQNKHLLVEYAHPNTHKEAHIGHTRTLMTGESIARILEANGATVFRANYQGDVGPHVAKAVYGIAKRLKEEGKTLDDYESLNDFDKIHFVAMSYALGNTDYEAHKEEIDGINKLIYKHGEGNPELWEIYRRTRQWSLDYYDDMYKLFGTKFDRLFLETEMAEEGPRIVRENIGKVFVQDADGSVYFPGEKYGLHTRVFITKANTPTYEGKEMALAFMEAKEFPFDTKIHVVGSEQEGYFKVVFKALELINPDKFVGKQYHLPSGMIQLKGRKMSSRTGDVLTYNQLIDEVKEHIHKQFEGREIEPDVVEKIALGAIKYSVLKGGIRQNVIFDMQTSISVQGNSGPYVQYTYTRTQSVLEKAGKQSFAFPTNYQPQEEEIRMLRIVQKFPEMVELAATTYSPNVITEYLFNLCQTFNNFYQKYRIVNAPKEEEKAFRLALTATVGIVIKQGLHLLGIAAPERM